MDATWNDTLSCMQHCYVSFAITPSLYIDQEETFIHEKAH